MFCPFLCFLLSNRASSLTDVALEMLLWGALLDTLCRVPVHLSEERASTALPMQNHCAERCGSSTCPTWPAVPIPRHSPL